MSFRFPKVFGRSADTISLLGRKQGLSTRDKKFAAELMHQQCWCWGRDIVSKENLLLRFGFERHRAPACPGSTRYELKTESMSIALWGFGLWVGLADGRNGYFSRYRRGVWLLPKNFDISGVHDNLQIDLQLRRPKPGKDFELALKLTGVVANWCEAYERWVGESEGLAHRRATLKKWEHPLVEAHEMAAAWRQVRETYQQWYRNGESYDAIGNVLARLRGQREPVKC